MSTAALLMQVPSVQTVRQPDQPPAVVPPRLAPFSQIKMPQGLHFQQQHSHYCRSIRMLREV